VKSIVQSKVVQSLWFNQIYIAMLVDSLE